MMGGKGGRKVGAISLKFELEVASRGGVIGAARNRFRVTRGIGRPAG